MAEADGLDKEQKAKAKAQPEVSANCMLRVMFALRGPLYSHRFFFLSLIAAVRRGWTWRPSTCNAAFAASVRR